MSSKIFKAYVPVSMTIGHLCGWYCVYKELKYDQFNVGPFEAALFVGATTCLAPYSPIIGAFYGGYKGVEYLAKRKN